MTNQKRRILSIALLVLAVVFLILSIVYIRQGFDKKDNYYMSDTYYMLNENAYVGGDAYNYIINGTYFAGYCALGGAMLVCACVLAVTGLKIFLSVDGGGETRKTGQPEIPAEIIGEIAETAAAAEAAPTEETPTEEAP